jgi:hypothetical protein
MAVSDELTRQRKAAICATDDQDPHADDPTALARKSYLTKPAPVALYP